MDQDALEFIENSASASKVLRIKACITILGLSIQIILVGLNPPWGVRGVSLSPLMSQVVMEPWSLGLSFSLLARGILPQAASL